MTWFFIDVKEVHFSLIDVVNLCMKEKWNEWKSNTYYEASSQFYQQMGSPLH